jgi:hypothetical protein
MSLERWIEARVRYYRWHTVVTARLRASLIRLSGRQTGLRQAFHLRSDAALFPSQAHQIEN